MTEQATGHPGPSDDTPPGQRAVLVVDLDGEPLAPLRALEEILLCLGTWEDDDRRDPSAVTEPLPVPAPLADRVALAAVQRLLTTLAPTQSQGPGRGRLLAPDGRYEHAPMTALTLPAADIDLLSAAALGHPGLDSDIADLVSTFAEQLGSGYHRTRPHRADLAPRTAGRPARPHPHRRHPTAHRPAAGHPARHRLRAQRRRGSRPRPHRRPHEPHLGPRLRHRPLPLLKPAAPGPPEVHRREQCVSRTESASARRTMPSMKPTRCDAQPGCSTG
ncbi:hypothetical protein SAMN05216574_13518 [Blastococcus tunisiensis]|uniref:Uncharacterized protein n=1 Tax=Blastococcus tunisiensis TaxID=1798228 RepID=A0A1I2MT40_9ACTN|nr:hypothetical protein SAMN05216574_13518 [Blastococcus sp. DSM 46838]